MPAKVKSDKASKAAADKVIADSYQHLSDLEHVLVRPDTYIGSSALVEDNIFIADIDSETPHIVKKKIEYVPELIKIFDEIILNAYDQTVRDGTGCTSIRVDIDQATGTISITNNGQGIPVIKKENMNCYIPEMLFGNLRTSSNYDDANSKKRITGGRNGLGGTLAVIFSKSFTLETIDKERKKHYAQSWTDNMSTKTEPVIKTVRSKAPFTKIIFVPDLARFKLESLSDDHVMLMKKRLIDIGFATHSHAKTYYDGNLISIKRANDYMKLYDHPENEKFIVDDTNERWTVGVVLSNNGFQHASFVNGIHTILGGTHVDHEVNQITKLIGDKIKSKIKNIAIKPSDIKNKIFVFIRAIIENPVFDSQAKETLKIRKLLNVRNATRSKVANNDEIKNIVRIVGLKYELTYEQDADMKSLREQKEIEPEWFAPVLPVILINGTHGIGTGFSSDVLHYNPVDIANYIKLMLMEKTPERNILPWYKGFTGEIVQVAQNRFTAYARWTFDSKKRILHITDLSINVSADSYKIFCEDLLNGKDSPLDKVLCNNTDTIVHFKLVFKKNEFETWLKMDREDLADKLRLKLAKKKVLSTSNMYLFGANGRIKKYSDVYEIIDEYYHVRLELYGARHEAIIEQLRYEMMILSNKTKFITMIKASKIDQRKMSEALLLAALEKNFEADPRASGTGLSRYEYLVSMSYRSFTDENATRMKTLVKKKEKKLKLIEATTAQQMWINDIDTIMDMLH
ncbi:hypothetical protein PC122_g14652 [Phytophthora cactorum]|nr:hypothetical protein PC122_g14652 [Phytophthora cactorum]